ncbi:MAG: LamG-like jellyroll fold domain-containing protein [Bacteroidia bacterium]
MKNQTSQTVMNRITKIVQILLFVIVMLFAKSITAQTGEALNFDGVNDYVSLNNLSLGGPGWTEFTFEAWINVTPNVYTSQCILRSSGSGFISFGLSAGFNILVYTNGGGVFSTNSPPINQGWQYVAFVVKSGASAIYVNGNIFGSTGTSFGYISQAINPCIGGTPGAGDFFNGSMDEVRIWKRALMQSEIQAHMNCEFDTSGQANLTALYHFNQGIAADTNSNDTLLYNAAGTGNGDLVNFALNGLTSNWVAPGGVASGINCTATPAEINVKGGSPPVTIPDGKTTFSFSDSTEFGFVKVSEPRTVHYTIENLGSTTLNISGINTAGIDSTMFIVSNVPTTIAPFSSATFNVTFAPNIAIFFYTYVHILSDDTDEGDYDFRIHGNGSCVNPTTIITGNAAFCPGDSTVLNSNPVAVAGTMTGYDWFRNNTLIANATGATYTATQSGTYKVVVHNSYGCNNLSNSFNVMTAPAISTSASPATICMGQSSMLNATTLIPTSQTYYVSQSGLVNMNNSCVGPGRFTDLSQGGISWADSGSGIVTGVQIQLSIGINSMGLTPLPTMLNTNISGAVVIAPGNQNCLGQSPLVTLNVNPVGYQVGATNTFWVYNLAANWGLISDYNNLGGYYAKVTVNYLSPAALSYLWMPGGMTNQSPVVSPTSSTVYTVTATGGGCTNTATQLVTVKPLPVVTANATPPAISNGQSSTLTVSTNPPFSIDSLTHTYNINAGNLVNLPISCVGATRLLTSGSGGFSWNDTGSGIVTDIEIQLYIGINFNADTPITTTLNGINTGTTFSTPYFSCPFSSTLLTLNINPAGYVVGGTNTFLATDLISYWGLDTNQPVLNGYYARVTVNYSSPNITFLWMPGNMTTESPVVMPSSTTTYTVTATMNGCEGSANQVITVGALNPVITGNTTICSGSSTTLDAGAGYASYNWSTGASTQTISVSSIGTYTVTVTNGNGNSGTASVSVSLTPAPGNYSTTNITQTTAVAHWDSAGAGVKYYVEKRLVGATLFEHVCTTMYAHLKLKDLIPGTQYEWRVRIVCSPGHFSDWSPLQQFTTASPVCTNTPTGVSATNLTSSSVKLHWNAMSPVPDNYQLRFRIVGATLWTAKSGLGSNIQKVLTGLIVGGNYEWQIRGRCGIVAPYDFSNWSAVSYFSLPATRMSADETDNSVNVFPNPGSGIVSVSIPDCDNCTYKLTMYDLVGNMVYSQMIIRHSELVSESVTLDFSSLTKGIYVLNVDDGEVRKIAKVVMQ